MNDLLDLSGKMRDPLARNDPYFDNRIELNPNSTTGLETIISSDEGYIVGRIGDQLLKYETDTHLITVSPTGGGKTSGVIIPNLLAHEGSTIVIDIRGETVAKTANAKRLKGQKVVVIDPYDITKGQWGRDAYNPFDRLLASKGTREEDDLIQRLVMALMHDPSGRMSNEPIWDNATKNLLSGLISYCVRFWPADRCNLTEVLDVLNLSGVEFNRFVDELAYLIENNDEAKDDRQIKGLFKTLTEAKSKTKITDNALVQAQTTLNWAGNRSFEDLLSHSTFSFDTIQHEPTTVYLVVPEQYIDNCSVWVRVMIESAIFSQKDVFSLWGTNTRELDQNKRVLFLLDELPAFGKLDVISSGMATLRGRGVNLWLFVQNLAQLNDIYEEQGAKTIIGNASFIQAFENDEIEELEYFIKIIGEEFFDIQSVTIQEGHSQSEAQSTGVSRSTNQSESFAHTKGRSDSIANTKGVNWSKAVTNAKQRGESENKSTGTNKGRSSNRGESSGSNKGKVYERNFLWSDYINSNKGKSNSANKGSGSSHGTNESKGHGSNFSASVSKTKSNGGSSSETVTSGTNESNTHTRQTGSSLTETENNTSTQSKSQSRSVTVKPERLKIETVRTLREKLSGGNQMIKIRGKQPFFVPRMSYFVKYHDSNRYIFPDMSIMASFEVLNELASRDLPESLSQTCSAKVENIEQIVQIATKTAQSLRNCNSAISASSENVDDYINLINVFSDAVSVHQVLKEEGGKTKVLYDEIAIALLSVISIFNEQMDWPVWGFYKEELLEDMQSFERANQENIVIQDEEISEFIRKISGLPIMRIKRENGCFVLDGHQISTLEYGWLIQTYTPFIQELINLMNTSVLQYCRKYDALVSLKAWMKDKLALSYRTIYTILEEKIEKEYKEKASRFN